MKTFHVSTTDILYQNLMYFQDFLSIFQKKLLSVHAQNAKQRRDCLDDTGKIKDLCLNGCFMFEKTFPSSVFFTFAMQNK